MLFALALEYQKEGDLPQTLIYFNAIIEKDPKYIGVYYHLGKLYEKLNDKPKAIEIYNKGIELTKTTDHHACRELQQALGDLDMDDDLVR